VPEPAESAASSNALRGIEEKWCMSASSRFLEGGYLTASISRRS
jgi:hypothetical protein